jgi:hypothetical protein
VLKGNPSRNEARTVTAQKCQWVDLILDFRAEGRKKSKFCGLMETHYMRRPGVKCPAILFGSAVATILLPHFPEYGVAVVY